jgi:transposase
MKRTALCAYEELSEKGLIDIFYGDESGVSLLPNVPYAWQFPDEVVTLPSERGGRLNCFALLSRCNRCFARFTDGKVTGAWIAEQINAFAKALERLTVIVLDNASVHTKAFRERFADWEAQGLFIFFLPPYSPHWNIAEILWKKLKYEWLQVADYQNKDTLHSAVRRLLGEVGKAKPLRVFDFFTSHEGESKFPHGAPTEETAPLRRVLDQAHPQAARLMVDYLRAKAAFLAWLDGEHIGLMQAKGYDLRRYFNGLTRHQPPEAIRWQAALIQGFYYYLRAHL